MKVSLIIPTYRRPIDLKNCLDAIKNQKRAVNEIIVIARNEDDETWDFLQRFDNQSLPLKTFSIDVPGVIAAMNLGLAKATGDIIAFTDDDSMPRDNWIEKIEVNFKADKAIGGVGGRDWIHQGSRVLDSSCSVVGRVQWFGRVIGNHHLGVGSPRYVDVLKGVNMSFRKSAIADIYFDDRMLGAGAQVHFELAFCLSLKKKGWKIIYDPAIAVDHYPAQRFDEDKRNLFSYEAKKNAVHNETFALMNYFAITQQIIFIFWATIVGTRDAYGLIQWLRFFIQGDEIATKKLLSSLHGRWLGMKNYHKSCSVPSNK
ncbi:MAG: glycosyl transferase family A [Leptolyngbya sp.]|nr:MAG: glycosyl transferase family A [Leptolyngbya sp.]